MTDANPPVDASQDAPSTADTPRSTAQATTWDWSLALLFLLACLIMLLPGGADPDLWGHIRFGRDVFREGVPATTTYSYTAEGYPWVNHEHLSELWFATMEERFGAAGLQTTRLVLAATVLGLSLVWWYRRGVPLLPTLACFALLVANLKYHWSIRPQLFTYSLFFLLIAWCELTFRGWAGDWHLPWLRSWGRASNEPSTFKTKSLWKLWLIVPLLLVWVNTHGGFAAGLAVAIAYLGCRAAELWLSDPRRSWGWILRLSLIFGALALVTLINPYGYRLPLWLSNIGIARPEITEWHGMDLSQAFSWLFFTLLGLSVAVLYYSRRPLDATHLCVGLLVAYQAIEHRRHIAFFVLLWLLWMPVHIQDVWAQLQQRYARHSAPEATPGRGWRWATALLALTLTGWLGYRISDIRVSRGDYPVGAIEYITRHQLGGKVVVAFNWAQYALAALADDQRLAPTTRVAFDGRFTTCYPESVLDTHFDFILGMVPGQRSRSADSPPFDPQRAIEDGQPDLVLIDRKQPHSCRVMRQQGDAWTMLYQDKISELWGRVATSSQQADNTANVTSNSADPTVKLALPNASPNGRWPVPLIVEETTRPGSVSWPAFPFRYLPIEPVTDTDTQAIAAAADSAPNGSSDEVDRPADTATTKPVTAPAIEQSSRSQYDAAPDKAETKGARNSHTNNQTDGA